MRESIDSLFCHVLTKYEHGSKSKSTIKTGVLEYVLNNQNKNLSEVAERYIESGFRQQNMTIFAQSLNSSVGSIIRDKKIDLLLENSQKALLKMAQDRNLPISRFAEERITERGYCFYKGNMDYFIDVKEKGMNDVSKVESCLKFINCLTEFCCGEPFFKDENQKSLTLKCNKTPLEELIEKSIEEIDKNNNESLHPSESIDIHNKLEEYTIPFEEIQAHEEFLKKLWEAGCLKCDITTRD
jgi:hypothetical protein